jgi:hypothetical protein
MSSTNVVELPDPMRRQWRVVSEDLRRWLLAEAIVSPVEAEGLLLSVEPVYLKWAVPKAFPIGNLNADGYAQVINDYFRQLLQGLLTEIVAREIMLIRAGLRG